MSKYPCVYMRGGTSKDVFFHEKDLPADRSQWKSLFLKVMGSPDKKQIDGMGGAHPTTSKIAVIAPSARDGIDVDYTFFQVAVEAAIVEDHANCGNISCGVGPFAVDEGLVEAREPVTIVRIYNTNTQKVIEEHVRVKNGRALTLGEEAITGVPGTGSRIDMYFERPGGATTGKLFPTGHKRDVLKPKGYPEVEVTMLDCSNPLVFIRAEDLGLKGAEIAEFQSDRALLAHIEAIRSQAAVAFGFVEDADRATSDSLSVPKVSVFSGPQSYVGSHGELVAAEEMDICSRIVSVGAFHKTHPVTAGIAIATAAAIDGTIVHDAARKTDGRRAFRVGHPYGVLPIMLVMDNENVVKGGTTRTARRIMDGTIYINDGEGAEI